jgi:uncharacterized protein
MSGRIAASIELDIAGERMQLLVDRALFWPARGRLLIADLHLGKGDVFRAAGIPLPSGGTAHDLARLDRLIATTGADELWVLGDLLHGATHHARWREGWERWRGAHAGLRVAALRGNHDRQRDAAGLEIEALGESVADGAILMRHEPCPHASLHVIAGHLHPALRLPGVRRPLPGFWLRPDVTVLPAFSAFSGGHVVACGQDDRFAVCADGHIALVGTRRERHAGDDTPGMKSPG